MLDVVLIAARAWLGSLFLYSSGLKLVRYRETRSAVIAYGILPPTVASAAGLLLPWAEAGAGVALLVGRPPIAGPLLGLALGGSFSYGAMRVIRRRQDVPCGCTGTAGERVNLVTLLRAGLIVASCFVLLIFSESAQLPPVAILVIAAASMLPALAAVYRKLRSSRKYDELRLASRTEVRRLEELLASPPT
jgi:hypothetical protein